MRMTPGQVFGFDLYEHGCSQACCSDQITALLVNISEAEPRGTDDVQGYLDYDRIHTASLIYGHLQPAEAIPPRRRPFILRPATECKMASGRLDSWGGVGMAVLLRRCLRPEKEDFQLEAPIRRNQQLT